MALLHQGGITKRKAAITRDNKFLAQLKKIPIYNKHQKCLDWLNEHFPEPIELVVEDVAVKYVKTQKLMNNKKKRAASEIVPKVEKKMLSRQDSALLDYEAKRDYRSRHSLMNPPKTKDVHKLKTDDYLSIIKDSKHLGNTKTTSAKKSVPLQKLKKSEIWQAEKYAMKCFGATQSEPAEPRRLKKIQANYPKKDVVKTSTEKDKISKGVSRPFLDGIEGEINNNAHQMSSYRANEVPINYISKPKQLEKEKKAVKQQKKLKQNKDSKQIRTMRDFHSMFAQTNELLLDEGDTATTRPIYTEFKRSSLPNDKPKKKINKQKKNVTKKLTTVQSAIGDKLDKI